MHQINMKAIFLIIILAFVFVFNQASTAQSKSKTKSIPPSQSNLEEMFGQPVSCNPDSATCFDLKSGNKITCPFTVGFTCFKNEQRVMIRVQFNEEKYAKKIVIFDANSWAAVQAGNQIVMLNGRGRMLKKGDRFSGSCDSDFTNEYEYLTMRYESKNCQGSHPGGVTITWKE